MAISFTGSAGGTIINGALQYEILARGQGSAQGLLCNAQYGRRAAAKKSHLPQSGTGL
jgi:hypothetical protein